MQWGQLMLWAGMPWRRGPTASFPRGTTGWAPLGCGRLRPWTLQVSGRRPSLSPRREGETTCCVPPADCRRPSHSAPRTPRTTPRPRDGLPRRRPRPGLGGGPGAAQRVAPRPCRPAGRRTASRVPDEAGSLHLPAAAGPPSPPSRGLRRPRPLTLPARPEGAEQG